MSAGWVALWNRERLKKDEQPESVFKCDCHSRVIMTFANVAPSIAFGERECMLVPWKNTRDAVLGGAC